ncbi:FmdE family protein [Dysgonomonas termitidis]|uniref:FmdE family protein n=1 Tax=Dysgonomonas termitidis TaxID=1516126 RepID=A0ABV9L1G2_9BACT
MVFNEFPQNPEFYSPDMRPMVTATIRKYGLSEWRAAVLTNELHGHLGIYAVIGVKMGLFALEQLGVAAGDLCITSFAGLNPPLSCMNDGLQVSTGATLGHGLIYSPPAEYPLAAAVFSTHDNAIRIKVKDRISNRIGNEIESAAERWGHAPGYWGHVRKLAVRYWSDLDRKEIFEVEPVKI